MGLVWKKGGTAKCGPFRVEIDRCGEGCRYEIFVRFGPGYKEEKVITGWRTTTMRTRYAAESWLRAQAHKMLDDLKGGK